MSPFIGEIIGTAMLVVLGDGVVANVILSKTKGYSGGLIAITFGWSMAVFVGVYVSAAASGAHRASLREGRLDHSQPGVRQPCGESRRERDRLLVRGGDGREVRHRQRVHAGDERHLPDGVEFAQEPVEPDLRRRGQPAHGARDHGGR